MPFSNYSQYPVVSRNSAKGNKRLLIPFSNYSQYPVVSRNSAKGIKNSKRTPFFTKSFFSKKFLMPFSKCSQYPVVGRISANGIKNFISLDDLLRKPVISRRELESHRV